MATASIYRQRLPRGRHSQPKTANTERRNQPPPPNRPSPVTQPKPTPLPRDDFLTSDEADVLATGGSVAGQPPRAKLDDNRGPARSSTASRNHSSASLHQEAVQPTQEIQPALWAPPTSAATSNGLEDGGAPTQRGDLFWSDPYEEHDTDPAGDFPMVDPTNNISLQNPAAKFPGAHAGTFGTLCFGGSISCTSPSLSNRDISIVLGRLCQVYLHQVDPVFKILHRPSLRKLLQHDSTYLGYPEGHASVIALSSAICYVATCSLSETQCRDMFQTSKAAVVAQYRRACETALDRADILVTGDITVLQAFVLYLVGRRSEGGEKVIWSLVALAIRLAKGMSLHADDTTTKPRGEPSFFDRQMRKRLWLTICVMDLQASFAHGSEPLIPVAEVSSALEGLRHLDDDDFDEQTTDEIPEREDLTCATFPFVTYHAQVSGRLLNYTGHQPQQQHDDVERPLSASGSASVRSHSSSMSSVYAPERGSYPSSFLMNRGSRERASAAFDRKAFELIRFCDPEASREAWFTWHSTQTLVASTRLAALRPQPLTLTGQERDNDAELQLAFRVLEKVRLMHTDSRCDGLRWYLGIPWHALAVAIAGCYVCTDEKMLRERWPLVEQVWQLQAGSSGSSSYSTVLASPLERLVRKTRERLGRIALARGGGNKDAMLANGGSPLSSQNIPPDRFSSTAPQQIPLFTPPLTMSSVASTSHLMTPTTPSSGTGVSQAPSGMCGGAGAAAPSFPSSDHHPHPQPQKIPSYHRVGSGSLGSGSHQSAFDATRLQHPNFTSGSFSMQGVEDDSSDQSQQDSLLNSIDLQDEDIVTIFGL